MKARAQECANAAMAAVTRVPPILYSEEDCQKFVEQTVKRAGGAMKDYAGSNDMLRNACTSVIPLGEAIAGKQLIPGMVLFIVAHDGGEPPQYKDSLGNASHVGWYTGGIYEVVHSSATRGGVAASTLKNGWTHAGKLKEVDYGGEAVPQPEPQPVPVGQTASIDLPVGETVHFRISPDRTSKWWANIRGGEPVELVSVSDGWARVKYGEHDGYVLAEFVTGAVGSGVPAVPTVIPTDIGNLLADMDRAYNALKQGLNKV